MSSSSEVQLELEVGLGLVEEEEEKASRMAESFTAVWNLSIAARRRRWSVNSPIPTYGLTCLIPTLKEGGS